MWLFLALSCTPSLTEAEYAAEMAAIMCAHEEACDTAHFYKNYDNIDMCIELTGPDSPLSGPARYADYDGEAAYTCVEAYQAQLGGACEDFEYISCVY